MSSSKEVRANLLPAARACDGGKDTQPDKSTRCEVTSEHANAAGACKSSGDGPRCERVRAVGHCRDGNKKATERNALDHRCRASSQELRQKCGKEDGRLRVEQRHDES